MGQKPKSETHIYSDTFVELLRDVHICVVLIKAGKDSKDIRDQYYYRMQRLYEAVFQDEFNCEQCFDIFVRKPTKQELDDARRP